MNLEDIECDQSYRGHNYDVGWCRGIGRSLARKWKARSIHRGVRKHIYDKSIYGSSESLPLVLRECLDRGLADHRGEIPLLVGHDIYLESDRNKRTFGYHEDRFGWPIFYQTEDDVSFYIPLRGVSEDTGGAFACRQTPRPQRRERKPKRMDQTICRLL